MRTLLTGLLVVLFISCETKEKPSYSKKTTQPNKKEVTQKEHPGKKLMEQNCYVCHNPTTPEGSRIAPPMIAIKRHYIGEETTKESFTKEMLAWIENPTEENAKMRGAVRRFGVMPKQPFPKKTIEQIAEYLFDFDIEKPEWFENHMKNGNHSQKKNSKEQGLEYALSTKAVLGKNLMGKIQKEGTIEALKFCNEKAFPLTDSMSVYHNAIIRRVSDKPRNPKNTANAKEKEYINIFKKDVLANRESEPIVIENTDNINFYFPIKTNNMCLQCHGKPNNEITTNTLAKIKQLYPSDKATGYGINQVRGIWSITFKK